MTDQSTTPKTVIDLNAICGDLHGVEAFTKIQAHVFGVLGLKSNDTSTKVWYLHDGLTNWWNAPASMVIDGKIVNGGFRTRAGYALNNRTPEQVEAAKGTGSSPADPLAPPKPPKPGFKVSVQFNDNGTANLTLGEVGEVVFDAESMTLAVPCVVMSTRSAKLAAIAGDAKAALLSATELGEDGKMIRECWKIESYSSDKVLAADAGMDILAQAGAAKDSVFVKAHGYGVMMGEELPTRFMGGGKKLAWVSKWMPELVKTEKAPNEPSEAPSDLDPKLVDTGMGS